MPQVAAGFGILQFLVFKLLPQHAVYRIAASLGNADAIKKGAEYQGCESSWIMIVLDGISNSDLARTTHLEKIQPG
jgi:hypothetical protein